MRAVLTRQGASKSDDLAPLAAAAHKLRRYATSLGERNEDILRSILEMSEAEIRQLYLDKIIVRDPSLEDEVSPAHVRRASG